MNKACASNSASESSDPRRILLLGATGQVGFELKRSLAPLGKLATPSRHDINLADPSALQEFLDSLQPDLIVNAAAWTAVDAAEEHPVQASAINALLPAVLAEHAARRTIWLVHYSTDYVYPGTGEIPWTETDVPAPLSCYGKTKLEGDLAIARSGVEHLIFRTSWVYSARGNNFMRTMLRLGAERDKLKVVSDQIGAPTSARLLAEVTLLALRGLHGNASNIPSGVYHVAPAGTTSWCGFAQAIFKHASRLGAKLALRPDAVQGIPTKEWPTAAARPLNSRLSVERIEAALNIRMPDWENQLAITLEELNLAT